MTAIADLKRAHRASWAAGDYAAVAELIDEVPPRDLLARVEVIPGQEVLDVAAGTGNIAIRAAAAGAQVVGLDLTPELFETARRRAQEHAVSVAWVEGDAEELPFEDERFDRVLSAFGVQFAPRHEVVAKELARVCRPGGRIGLVNWTPEGQIGELFKIMGRYMPAPPDYASPPPLWGSEDHVRGLFAGSEVQHRLIRYHRRGQAGSTPVAAPVSFADHASDAASLLDHLGVRRAHVVGHSTGAAIALELAIGHPELVETLALLEPPLFAVPSAEAFLENAGPLLEAYGAGDRETAMVGFLSAVSGLDWETCRAVIDEHVPGGADRALAEADFFFASDLPALNDWAFGSDKAAAVSQPILSVLGSESERLFVEGRDLLRSWFPQIEDRTVEGIGHLLHIQDPEPVARTIADFLGRHAITAS